MAEPLPPDWGARLRRERKRRGWSREQLAAKIKYGEDTIYNWEERGAKPRPQALQALEAVFKKPVEAWGQPIWRVPYLPSLYFTGREQVLDYLYKRLGRRALREPKQLPVALSQARAISGLGGIGKTQTAVEYARRFGHEYDLVVLVRADSRNGLIAELAGLAPLLGLPTTETNQEYLAKAVKRSLEAEQELPWLLIFDNVDDLELVKEFLPAKGNGAVLLTTRLGGVGQYIHKYELDAWPLEDGLQFFRARVGSGEEQERKVLSEEERQAAAELYTLLGGLPLAMEQAAAYIEEEECSLAEYLSLYQQQPSELLRRTSRIDQQEYPHSVATTWLISFRRVEQNPEAVEVLRLLAFLHADAIPEELLQAFIEDPARLQAAITLLQEYSLLRRNAETRMLTIHRLVQAVIQDGLKVAETRQWADCAARLVNRAFPDGTFETWERCEQLLPHVLLFANHIQAWQIASAEAGDLFHRAGEYLYWRGRSGEALSLTRLALTIRKQVLPPTHPDIAESLNNLGYGYDELGHYTEALPFYQDALKMWEQALGPDDPLMAVALNNVADTHRELGQYVEARRLYQRALAIREQAKGLSDPSVAETLNNLALLYQAQGQYAAARRHFERAVTIWKQALGPGHPRVAQGLSNLGGLAREQGRYAEALQLVQQAIAISERAHGEIHPDVAQGKRKLAEIYQAQGHFAEALPLYQRSLAIYEQAVGPNHPYATRVLNSLGGLYREQGKYEEALPFYQQALASREQALGPVHPDTAETMYDLARLREAQGGHHEEARRGYERALAVRAQALGAQHLKTRETRQCLIELLHTMGQHEEAVPLEAAQTEQGPEKEA